MGHLTEGQIEKLKLWFNLTPKLILFGVFVIMIASLTGLRKFEGPSLPYVYFAVGVVFAVGYVMRRVVRTKKVPPALIHTCFAIDILAFMAAIYFNGGIEQPWTFVPAFVTFMGAYVFGMMWGMIYAAFVSFSYMAMFVMVYYRIIPHFPAYNLPNLLWTNTAYFIDSLVGIFLLNFVMAFAVALVSGLVDKRNRRIEEYELEFADFDRNMAPLVDEEKKLAAAVKGKDAVIERSRKFIEDRRREIEGLEFEIQGLKGGGGH